MCRCGHPRQAHRHYRPGSDCGMCGCKEQERRRTMRRTNLRGHALRGEGAAHYRETDGSWIRCRGHIGFGLCECGETSDCEWSNAARKRWHARHKDAIRGAFDGAPGHG